MLVKDIIVDVSLLADESVRICENGREVEVKGNGHYGGKGFYLRAGGKEGTEEVSEGVGAGVG